MSKNWRLLSKLSLLVILFPVLFFFSKVAQAQTISPIGNLDPDTTSKITVTSLDRDTIYALIIKKVRSIDQKPLFGGNIDYATFSTNCINSGSGTIEKSYEPFRLPGFYRLDIIKANNVPGSCVPFGNIIVSQEFSVGGPVPGSSKVGSFPTQECCDAGIPIHDRDRDVCKKFALPLIGTEATNPTICSKNNSFCEPESLKCFKKPTMVVRGKVCKEPQPNSDFDPANNIGTDRYIVCGSSGGQKIEGCTNDPDNPAIATAIGCIHTNPAEFTKDIMKFVLGIAGGLAFLMMLLGAFQILSSADNPDTLKAGRERLTSAVIGLLLVIFAILLLQIIGIGILDIPGFKKI